MGLDWVCLVWVVDGFVLVLFCLSLVVMILGCGFGDCVVLRLRVVLVDYVCLRLVTLRCLAVFCLV